MSQKSNSSCGDQSFDQSFDSQDNDVKQLVFMVKRYDKKKKKFKNLTKHKKLISKCPHQDGEYYANGMCRNCYHSNGRKKAAFVCLHTGRLHYAKGLCKNCYLRLYHKKNTCGQKRQRRRNTTSVEPTNQQESLIQKDSPQLVIRDDVSMKSDEGSVKSGVSSTSSKCK